MLIIKLKPYKIVFYIAFVIVMAFLPSCISSHSTIKASNGSIVELWKKLPIEYQSHSYQNVKGIEGKDSMTIKENNHYLCYGKYASKSTAVGDTPYAVKLFSSNNGREFLFVSREQEENACFLFKLDVFEVKGKHLIKRELKNFFTTNQFNESLYFTQQQTDSVRSLVYVLQHVSKEGDWEFEHSVRTFIHSTENVLELNIEYCQPIAVDELLFYEEYEMSYKEFVKQIDHFSQNRKWKWNPNMSKFELQ